MMLDKDLQLQISGRGSAMIDHFNAVTEREPWNTLPSGERINYLRHLIRPLSEIAVSDRADRRMYLRALHIAAHHGERRQHQGLPESIVFDDLSFFRWAFCSQIPLKGDLLYLETVSRIDKLLTLASSAALRGYHREVFEERGEWPDVLEVLVGGDEEEGAPRSVTAATSGSNRDEDSEWAQMYDLAEAFVADARRWLQGVRQVGPEAQRIENRLFSAVLDEYAGALDLLEVVRGEIQPGPQGGSAGIEALVISGSGNVEFTNHFAVESFGYPSYELRGSSLFELLHPDDRSHVRELLKLIPRTVSTPVRSRARLRHAEGSWLELELSIRPLLLGAESSRYLLRGRVGAITVDDTLQPGGRGRFFKRHRIDAPEAPTHRKSSETRADE